MSAVVLSSKFQASLQLPSFQSITDSTRSVYYGSGYYYDYYDHDMAVAVVIIIIIIIVIVIVINMIMIMIMAVTNATCEQGHRMMVQT